jgi:rhomboid protease GluP
MEKKALAVLDVPDDSPKRGWTSALQDTGIYYWNQCIRVLDKADELQVSDLLKRRDDALIRYCNLRILSYNHLYKINDLLDSLNSGK